MELGKILFRPQVLRPSFIQKVFCVEDMSVFGHDQCVSYEVHPTELRVLRVSTGFVRGNIIPNNGKYVVNFKVS